MKILIAAIGKTKRGPEQELFALYQKRLPWKIILKEMEAKHGLPPTRRKQEESALLAGACKNAERIVLLDESGAQLSSRTFAQQLATWQQRSDSAVAFVIGGADGVEKAALPRLDLTLAFGSATWPHMLVRAMLMEQLYRAHTLITNHPYHRD